MFDEMSHWQRLVGTLSVSPQLVMLLDSKSANVAQLSFDQRKSNDSSKQRTNFYCNNADPELCDAKRQVKLLTQNFDLPKIASEILQESKVNNLLEDFMSFVKDRCSRQELTDLLAKSPEHVKFHSKLRESHL